MKQILRKTSIIADVREASRAYARVARYYVDQLDNADVRLVVSYILNWRALQSAPKSRVSSDAAFLARFEADNFAEKLCGAMKEPIGFSGLAAKLQVAQPTIDEALAAHRRLLSKGSKSKHNDPPNRT